MGTFTADNGRRKLYPGFSEKIPIKSTDEQRYVQELKRKLIVFGDFSLKGQSNPLEMFQRSKNLPMAIRKGRHFWLKWVTFDPVRNVEVSRRGFSTPRSISHDPRHVGLSKVFSISEILPTSSFIPRVSWCTAAVFLSFIVFFYSSTAWLSLIYR